MRYQSLKLNLNFLLLLLLFTEWFQTEKEFTTVFEEIYPQELNKFLQAVSVKTAKPNFNGGQLFSFHYGSVNSKRAHPPSPSICGAFVILFWKSCKCPTVGLKNIVQIPHQWTTPIENCIFQKISWKYHFYGKSLIVRSKRVNPLRKSLLAATYNYCKK